MVYNLISNFSARVYRKCIDIFTIFLPMEVAMYTKNYLI